MTRLTHGAQAREPGFLSDPDLRLIWFGGKGGVGKTTCAVATALTLAERRSSERFLLLSVDPAHSLLDSLGSEAPPANLDVRELDAAACLAVFNERHRGELREIARRGTFLDEEDIGRFLGLSLPGMDEVFALLEIAELAREGAHRTVVVDTAPTGHTLRLLAVPELLRAWLDMLDTLLAKHRYMTEVFRGAYRRDAQDELILNLSSALTRAEDLFRSKASCFVPVAEPEAPSLLETARLLSSLRERRINVGDVVINRVVPALDCAACAGARSAQMRALARNGADLGDRRLWALPLHAGEVRGAAELSSLWRGATPLPLDAAVTLPGAAAPPRAPNHESSGLRSAGVERPAELPGEGVRLIVFAGKGGVGKTTLACATALRIARGGVRGGPARRVSLFSTDPARSLGDALGRAIGPEPVEIAPGVRALALDAAAELAAWQERYLDELADALSSESINIDFTFDQRVMEGLFQLCPPGVDEIMALTRVVDLLSEDPRDVLVLDTAPTGHLVRLLEMPALLDQWLKAIFAVLLKYKDVLRVPRFADGMIKLSRDLKALRALMTDPARASLYAVTIPTSMALEETRDLLASCGRLRIPARRLFINLVTPVSPCPLCEAQNERERREIAHFRQALPDVGATIIHRREAPLGTAALSRLGEDLYAGGPDPGLGEEAESHGE